MVISDKVTTTSTTTTTTYDVTREPNSELERGYELANEKTTQTKPTISSENSKNAEPALKKNAVNAAKENFKEYAEDAIDRTSENFKASEKRFWESIKKF